MSARKKPGKQRSARGPANILFIMCDQLRWDYLSCYGHAALETPNIDRLAHEGVRFDRAYVQSPICGPSRMSFYTGRYMSSHGSTWNGFPLRVGEYTLGDYLGSLGMDTVLVGKTHMAADYEGMARLGVDPRSFIGVHVSQCGFEPFERDDGLYPARDDRPVYTRYNMYLNEAGFEGNNPWHEWANSGQVGKRGRPRSGWWLKNSRLPARIPDEYAETPYMTRRAMDFIDQAGERPWCLHLSYIKPHWPYIVSAPYHDMYGRDDIQAVQRSRVEKSDPHPVYRAFMNHRDSKIFSTKKCRDAVIPAYMGLIRQIDDQLGLLFDFLRKRNLWDDTLIVFTSDHGDYLGDHWLGEKELFHECSVRIPLIVRDPSRAANRTRGRVSHDLVEAIDLAPTFIEYAGGRPPSHRLEGRSLRAAIHGKRAGAREHAVSEYDYSVREACQELGVRPKDARIYMVRSERWKYLFYEGFAEQLFDLENDPLEYRDLGREPSFAPVRAEMKDRLFDWSRTLKHRTTVAEESLEGLTGYAESSGIYIGWWDEGG